MKNPEIFIVCPPRSGSSLLTVLLNSHSQIAIAQDTSVFSSFKTAMALTNQAREGKKIVTVDHPLGELTPKTVEKLKTATLYSYNVEHRLMLYYYLKALEKFHSVDTFKADPRKDRGFGKKYLDYIDFESIVDRFKTEGIFAKEIFNSIIHHIIKGVGIKGTVLGEKTPSHVADSNFILSLYENSKIINLVRNPISTIGSRRQRIDDSMENHCLYYIVCLSHMVDSPRTMFVKYEDILSDPGQVCKSIHTFLGLEPEDLPENLESGIYPKYVGLKVDPERDKENFKRVTEEERVLIRQCCKETFEKFYADE